MKAIIALLLTFVFAFASNGQSQTVKIQFEQSVSNSISNIEYVGKDKTTADSLYINSVILLDTAAQSLIINAYASVEGRADSNLSLAANRAKFVVEQIVNLGYKGQINVNVVGETKQFGKSLAANRVVTIDYVNIVLNSNNTTIDTITPTVPAKRLFNKPQANHTAEISVTENAIVEIAPERKIDTTSTSVVPVEMNAAIGESISPDSVNSSVAQIEVAPIQTIEIPVVTNKLDSASASLSHVKANVCGCVLENIYVDNAHKYFKESKDAWSNGKTTRESREEMYQAWQTWKFTQQQLKQCYKQARKQTNAFYAQKISSVSSINKKPSHKAKARRVKMRPTRGLSGRGLARIFPFINC
jgi:hypothetical protein